MAFWVWTDHGAIKADDKTGRQHHKLYSDQKESTLGRRRKTATKEDTEIRLFWRCCSNLVEWDVQTGPIYAEGRDETCLPTSSRPGWK